jgi:hypothetical protein
MRRIKGLPRFIIFTILCAVLFSPTLPGRAQEPQTVTGTGTMLFFYHAPLTMTFPPAGGPVTGSAVVDTHSRPGYCPVTMNFTFSGTFAGGDGGAASGTWMATGTGEKTETCTGGTLEMNETWNGNFYANGTGDGELTGEFKTWWQVTYSPEEFAAALNPPVTKDYILTTYGLKLEGSYEKDWSEHELSLMNDVLSQIPADLWKKMALTSIIRSDVNIDPTTLKQEPDVFGNYSRCGDLMGSVDCSGSSAHITIFDRATSPYDFTNDPNGDTEFKATILHEMIHAMQYQKDASSTYSNASASPLVQNYMDATRPKVGAGITHNGWAYYGEKKGWMLYSDPGDLPPTNYGKTNPMEDMSESAMMYVYDPQKLQASSPQRYDFIKTQMFGGVEYENGIQKKP